MCALDSVENVEVQGVQMAGATGPTRFQPATQVMAPPRAEPLPQTEQTARCSLPFDACPLRAA